MRKKGKVFAVAGVTPYAGLLLHVLVQILAKLRRTKTMVMSTTAAGLYCVFNLPSKDRYKLITAERFDRGKMASMKSYFHHFAEGDLFQKTV